MVNCIAASEAKDLTKFPNLSIGLHFDLKDLLDVQAELERQINKFITIVGRSPDHIDTHKRSTNDEGIKEVLNDYAKTYNVPVRNFNAKHIRSFGVNSHDGSINQLKRSIDEATEECNELMTHVGYSDDYLRENSSYSDPREEELESIESLDTKRHIHDSGLVLISWSDLKNIRDA